MRLEAPGRGINVLGMMQKVWIFNAIIEPLNITSEVLLNEYYMSLQFKLLLLGVCYYS